MDKLKQDLDKYITKEPESSPYDETYERYIDEVSPEDRFEFLISKIAETRRKQTEKQIDESDIYDELISKLEEDFMEELEQILEERYGIK